jgi:hypothetical protein
MAKKDNKQGRIIEIVILVFAIICIALVVVDMSVNLSRVTDTQKNRAEIKLGETDPTPDSRFFSPDFQEVLRRGEKNSAQE